MLSKKQIKHLALVSAGLNPKEWARKKGTRAMKSKRDAERRGNYKHKSRAWD
jgi:hypothetical protein